MWQISWNWSYRWLGVGKEKHEEQQVQVAGHKEVDSPASLLPQICLFPGRTARELCARMSAPPGGGLGGPEDGLWPQAPLSMLS